MNNIVCMKLDTVFDAGFVNKLYAMAGRNITGDFRFFCLADGPAGLNPGIEHRDFSAISGPPPWCKTGWRKIALWIAILPGMEGYCLYLDMDVTATGSLDASFDYLPE